jgi:hypothetical protein
MIPIAGRSYLRVSAPPDLRTFQPRVFGRRAPGASVLCRFGEMLLTLRDHPSGLTVR